MIPWLALALGTAAAVEAGARLPFRVRLAALRGTLVRVAGAVSSSGSERRKQAVLMACARRLLAGSVALFALLLAALAPFAATVALFELAGGGVLAPAASAGGIVGCAVFAAGYAMLRRHAARLFSGRQAASPSGP